MRLILAALAMVTLGACSTADKPKTPPGRCTVNNECPAGQACRNTYCEDIYHPRREIKPY